MIRLCSASDDDGSGLKASLSYARVKAAAAFDTVDSEEEMEFNLARSKPVRSAAPQPAVPAPATAFVSEVAELDALERELGLDLGMSSALADTVAPRVSSPAPPAAAQVSVPVDVDTETDAVIVSADQPVAASAPAAVNAAHADDDIDALESFLDNL